MRKLDRLFSLAPAQIRMNHASGDRPWSDDADLNHQIVKSFWPKPGQHRHLGVAFNLKNTDGIAAANHLKGRGILVRNGRHRQLLAAMLAQQPKTEIELG